MKKATVFLSLVSAILISCGPTSEAPESNSTTSKDAVIENIMSRRSIRKYKNEAIDSTSMREILTCGIQAPNGQGRESWEIRAYKKGFIRRTGTCVHCIRHNLRPFAG